MGNIEAVAAQIYSGKSSERDSGRAPLPNLAPQSVLLYCLHNSCPFSPPLTAILPQFLRDLNALMERSRPKEQDAANRMSKFVLVRILWLVQNRQFWTYGRVLLLLLRKL